MDDDLTGKRGKSARVYRCYGGPMDGAEIECRKVFDNVAIEGIQRSLYTTGLNKPDQEFWAWEWSKEGCGDSVVKYRLEKGGRLVYSPAKRLP